MKAWRRASALRADVLWRRALALRSRASRSAKALRHFPWAFFVVGLAAQTSMDVPRFTVDPSWPKPLPNHWIVGAVVGVAVDSHDHIWITHRPSTLQPNETRSFWT